MRVNSAATLVFPFGCRRPERNKFDFIHCDLWTSPIVSISGYKYYLVILDDCFHYLWTFPLRLKSDTYDTLANFFSYVTTQFGATVKAVQCDNGCKFDNSNAQTFFLTRGTHLRMSCPYTLPQNILNLLFQASLPPSYWVEALSTATYLLNLLPNKTLGMTTPHMALYGSPPPMTISASSVADATQT